MAASNNDDDDGSTTTATSPLSINRSGTERCSLPLSIAVRNLFPPLASSDAAIPGNDSVTASVVADGGEENEAGQNPARRSNNDTPSSSPPPLKHQSIRQRRIKSLASKIAASSLVEDRCALVSREVLLRLRLDIITKNPDLPACCDDDKDEYDARDISNTPHNDEIVLYSCKQSHCTAHPRWDHINEQISNSTTFNISNDTFARFVISEDVQNNDQSSLFTDTKTSVNSNEWILAEVPLHPSQLRRLPANVESDTDHNNNYNTMIIPHSLPPNTIILHYDDGYTRVLPNLYRLLVQRGIITEGVMDFIKREGSGRTQYGNKDRGGTFEEKAFDVLGGKSTTDSSEVADDDSKGRKNGSKNTSQASMYDDDRVFDLLGKCTTTDSNHAQPVQKNQLATKSNDSVFDDRALDLIGKPTITQSDATPDSIATENSKRGEPGLVPEETSIESNTASGETVDEIDLSRMQSEDASNDEREGIVPSLTPLASTQSEKAQLLPLPPVLFTKDIASANTSEEEVEELRRLVWEEQQLLEEEQNRMIHGTNRLKSIIHQVQQLEKETFEMIKAVGAARTNLFRSEFRLEAHRIHLLQQLQLIFPIKLVTAHISVNPPDDYPLHQYTVAGLVFPDDIHNLTVSDDQVSTVLGFLCHFVSLTSKYLAIPLRYTIVCKWSRSAILFDQGRDRGNASKVVYPLFRERGVIDREQLDYGLMLLERNVDCLLRMRHVAFQQTWNVVAKMDKLLMQVIEGEDPSFGGNAG